MVIWLLFFGFWAFNGTATDLDKAFQDALQKVATTKREKKISTLKDMTLFKTLETAVANDQEKACGDMNTSSKEGSAIFVQRTYAVKAGCTVRTAPLNTETLRTQYSWSTIGRLQISDVGPTKKSPGYPTGSRAYYIVPSNSIPSLKSQGTSFQITTHDSLLWSIDKLTGDLELPKECKGTVVPTAKGNKGGLELERCDNKLVIDVGWGKDAPERNQEGFSMIRDPNGNFCQVKNTSLFMYVPETWKEKGKDYEYNHYRRFRTSDEWFRFLKNPKNPCHKLNLDFLVQANSVQ